MNALVRLRLSAHRLIQAPVKQWRKAWSKLKSLPSRKDLEPPKDDKEFQRRVLSSLEKPSPSLVLKIVNAPFFLWLLTAVVFTLGVGYYNAFRTCIDDGEKISAKYAAISNELAYRWQELSIYIARDATSIADIKKYLDTQNVFQASDLKTKTVPELMNERYAARTRVDFYRALANPPGTDLLELPGSDKFAIIFVYWVVPATITDADLEELKIFSLLADTAFLNESRQESRTVYEPYCGIATILQLAMGKRPSILRGFDGDLYGKKVPYPPNAPSNLQIK